MSISKAVIDQYLDAGKRLVPTRQKIPLIKDWVNAKVPASKLYKHKGNMAFVMGPKDFVLDVDLKDARAADSLDKLIDDVCEHGDGWPSEAQEPTVSTPSGGFHIYFEIPKAYRGKAWRTVLESKYPGLEFLTRGQKCTIPGSHTDAKGNTAEGFYTWGDEDFGCFEQHPLPRGLADIVSYDPKAKIDDDLGDFEGMVGGESSNWSAEKVEGLLERLDPSMSFNDWVRVGMALHDWSPVDGFDYFENWSKGGDSYEDGACATQWASFDVGDGVTLGTVAHMAKAADFDKGRQVVVNLVDKIKRADERELTIDIMADLRNVELGPFQREIVFKGLQDRFKELTGARLPIGDIRKMVGAAKSTVEVEKIKRPDWCKGWLYVNTHTSFFDLQTLTPHKAESFNLENGKYIPINDSGSKPSATKYVSDNGFIGKVDGLAYLPHVDEVVCEVNGGSVLNTFNSMTVPLEAERYTAEGKDAIRAVKKQVKLICTTDEHTDILLQWLAHQVQRPGRQILWAPVIQSIEGVGKSFFSELLRVCLGDRNVGTVGPGDVVGQYNGWATGVVVNILEELRIKGHNRHEAVNALKPLITDRIIPINDKFVKQHNTANTANYMCFTNYKDALPLTGDDRRWWVIFVPITDIEQVGQIVGEHHTTYYPKLFDTLRKHAAEVRKWLLEYPITDEFLNTKQAPMTTHKMSMIATEELNFEGLTETKALIEQGGQYFKVGCLSSSDLFEALTMEALDIELNNRTKNTILQKLGYTSLAKPVKIDGKARRVWTLSPMTNNEVRAKLGKKDV